jgi:hypothetical protein
MAVEIGRPAFDEDPAPGLLPPRGGPSGMTRRGKTSRRRETTRMSNTYVGTWRIIEMAQGDHASIALLVPGYITFREDHLGEFQFGTVHGDLDYRIEPYQYTERLEFAWEGGRRHGPSPWTRMGDDPGWTTPGKTLLSRRGCPQRSCRKRGMNPQPPVTSEAESHEGGAQRYRRCRSLRLCVVAPHIVGSLLTDYPKR